MLAGWPDWPGKPAWRPPGEPGQVYSGAGDGSGRRWVCISLLHLGSGQTLQQTGDWTGEEIQTWICVKISQPEVTVLTTSQTYLEELQLPESDVMGEETVSGGGHHVVVGSLPPGLSPEVRAVR